MNTATKGRLFKKEVKIKLILFLLVFIGLVLRLYKLGAHNIWYDEYMTVRFIRFIAANSTIPEFLDFPFYALLMTFWTRFFGEGEFSIRFLSMLFGTLSIPLIYKLGKIFFDEKIGLVSAFILAISPIHIWYSQEARRYALSVYLGMLLIYFLYSAVKTERKMHWIGFMLSSIAGLYTNYFSFIFLPLSATIFIFSGRRHLVKYYLASISCIVFAFLLVIPYFMTAMVSIQDNFWVPRPGFKVISATFENFNVGYNATALVYSVSSLIFYPLFILGLTYFKKRRQELVFLLILVFFPVTATYFLSQWSPIYMDRQMLLFSPFYYLIVAAGFMKINSIIVRSTLIFCILVLTFICLHNYFSGNMPAPLSHHVGVYPKKSNEQVVEYFKSKGKIGDKAATSTLCAWHFNYYLKEYDPEKNTYFFFIDPIFKQYDSYAYNFTKYIRIEKMKRGFALNNFVQLDDRISEIPEAKPIRECDFKKIWLVSSSWARDANYEPNVIAVRKWMHEHYRLLEAKKIDGIIIELFVPKDK